MVPKRGTQTAIWLGRQVAANSEKAHNLRALSVIAGAGFEPATFGL
jgi:hypothetical protein